MATYTKKTFKKWNGSSWENLGFYTPASAILAETSSLTNNVGTLGGNIVTYDQRKWLDELFGITLGDNGSYTVGNISPTLVNAIDTLTGNVTKAQLVNLLGGTTSSDLVKYSTFSTRVSTLETTINTVNNKLGNYMPTATYIENNKIKQAYLPDFVLGQMVYGGTVSISSSGVATATLSDNAKTKLSVTSNTLVLSTSETTTSKQGYKDNQGIYYLTTTKGTFNNISYEIGDWLLATASSWSKVDNTDAVTSVNTRIGDVSVYQGVFSTSKPYYPGDIVKKGDELYVCVSGCSSATESTFLNYFTITGKVYSNATTTTAGLMSAEDKVKLTGLSNYTLPVATDSALGGVKIGYTETTLQDTLALKLSNNNAYVKVPDTYKRVFYSTTETSGLTLKVGDILIS